LKKTKGKKKSIFAKNIIARREALGWNQSDLAHKTGLGLNTIKSIERDVSEGNPRTKRYIAEALGCEVEDLFSRAPQEPESNTGGPALSKPAVSKAELLQIMRDILGADVDIDPKSIRVIEGPTPPEPAHVPANILEGWNHSPQPLKLLVAFLVTGRRIYLEELEHSYPSAVRYSKQILEAHKGLLKARS
jgi:transcriptional regulator with XRE-family HTH domain